MSKTETQCQAKVKSTDTQLILSGTFVANGGMNNEASRSNKNLTMNLSVPLNL